MCHCFKKGEFMKTRNLCLYLDKIREAKNITRVDFLHDVVSVRQYKRYLYGESEMPYSIVEKLCNKLGVKFYHILNDFDSRVKNETKKLNQLYRSVVRYDFEKYKTLIREFNESHVLNERNIIYYKHITILYKYYSGSASIAYVIDASIKLIDYPKVLNNDVFDSIDLIILSFLMSVLNEEVKCKIEKVLLKVFNSEDSVIYGESSFILRYILINLINRLGVKGEYDNVIEYCDLGLTQANVNMEYLNTEFLYYYKALAAHKIGNIKLRDESIYLCYGILGLSKDKSNFIKFNKLIEKDFGIVRKEFLLDYINKNKYFN
jgi:hypothetical protein